MYSIQASGVKFTIVKQDGRRALIQWIESTGVLKERWLILDRQNILVNLLK